MRHRFRLLPLIAIAAASLVTIAPGDIAQAAPMTFLADTLSDNPADGYTLREALNDANLAPGADVITFAPELSGTLTLTGGQLDVTDDLTIRGHEDLSIAISGNDSTRIIHSFFPGVSLTVEDLVLTDGRAAALGGAISFGQGDDLMVDNVDIIGNTTASKGGGGVSVTDVNGTVTILDSHFEGNTATGGHGGGLYVTNHAAGDDILVERTSFVGNTAVVGRGGGVDISADSVSVWFKDSEVSGNDATAGDAGGIRVRGASVRLTDAPVTDNTAGDDNGGLYLVSTAGNVILERGDISGNQAHEAGGGTIDADQHAQLFSLGITDNSADGVGGLRVSAQQRVLIQRSTIAANTASVVGGGIVVLNSAEFRLSRSTVSNNAAPEMGGIGLIDVRDARLSDSTVHDNEATAGDGGGVHASGSAPDFLHLAQSTVSGNSASGDGGAIFADAVNVTGAESTITANSATGSGGGIFLTGAADLAIVNTIVSGNDAPTFPDLTGPVLANYSLLGDTTGVPFIGGGNNQTSTDPLLGPLGDNGGDLPTHLPMPGSPAIDAGTAVGVTSTVDQRNFPRLVGEIDIGSVETASPASSLWVPVPPARIVETRPGQATIDGVDQGDGPFDGGEERRIAVAGRAGVPADARAVIANITAVAPAADGFLTAHPCVDPRPFTASLNYTTGVNLGDEVIVGLDNGDMCVFSSGATQMTIDVVGYVPAASTYVPVDPERLLDTRAGGTTVDGDYAGIGAPGDGGMLEVEVENRGSIPNATDMVVVYVAAINADRAGFVTVWDCETEQPLASSLNYVAGTTRGNEVVVALDEFTMCLFTSDEADLTVDIVGYVPEAEPHNAVEIAAPGRLLDTRPGESTIDGLFAGGGTVGAGETLTLNVAGRGDAPLSPDTITMNLTAVNPSAVGFVTAFPCGGALPLAASLNYVPGVNGGNEIIASPNADGDICLFTSAATHLTVDITGATTL